MRLPVIFSLGLACLTSAGMAYADSECAKLPTHAQLKAALITARAENNGGLNSDMWGTIVDRSGLVCAVAYSGKATDSQWPGSRVISAQKANTANSFSLPGLALSTANLFSIVQPGKPLFGLQESNPVNPEVAYKGSSSTFGTEDDPMVDQRVGGVNVFGGGLALYDAQGTILGGIGVSGDTSCADHNIAWKTRKTLSLDHVPAGVSPTKSDQIIYDVKSGVSEGGYGHPACGGKESEVSLTLASVSPIQEKIEKK